MAAGNPKPNYYAASPLVAATLDGFDGLFHGDDKSPATKHVTHIGAVTPTAAVLGRLTMLDYLLYYPFVDGDAAGEAQSMDNTVVLPRSTDGMGVQVMAVAVAPTLGGSSFNFEYIDSNGDPQTSNTISANTTAANIATIITSEQAQVAGGRPFLPLIGNAAGIRSITAVNVLTAMGGLFSLVLVKPVLDIAIREISTMAERNFVRQTPFPPKVEDGAYLNWILNPAGSVAAGILTGYCNFAWGE